MGVCFSLDPVTFYCLVWCFHLEMLPHPVVLRPRGLKTVRDHLFHIKNQGQRTIVPVAHELMSLWRLSLVPRSHTVALQACAETSCVDTHVSTLKFSSPSYQSFDGDKRASVHLQTHSHTCVHASFEATEAPFEYSLIHRCSLDSKIEQKLSQQLQNQNPIAQWGTCKYTWAQASRFIH